MCGLTGFLGPFPPERIYAMNALVSHRGPDDEDYFFDSSAGVALGHRRLAIIDLRPEARQPMTNEDGSLRLVFNGEIYNYRELRRELEQKGHLFHSLSDSETIIHLYEEEGYEAVRRLKGIFALALWDARSRRLLLARDHLGIKPLYYAELKDGIAFASELKALMVFPEISRELDPQAIHQHLSYIWSAAPHTMLRGVKKLEPGYRLVAGCEGVLSHEAFYDLPYDGARTGGTRSEHEERIRELVRQAVDRQMVSDVPVGAFLSGGLDSSSVVAMMRRATEEKIRCYSIGFGDDERPDANPIDLPFARIVAEHFDLDLVEVRVRPDIIDFTERMVYLLDEPQADPACINVYLISQQARADGYKVLLSGAGGDDIFSGYRRHQALHLERYWGWLPESVRRLLARGVRPLRVSTTLSRRIQKYFLFADQKPEDRMMAYFLWTTDEALCALYTEDLRHQLSDYDTLDPLRKTLSRIPRESDPLNRMLYLEAKHFLPDHNLNYTDKMSMAHGVEVRVPLLDLDLVDYAVHLPSGEKQQGTRIKAVFKDAMRPVLPRAIINRAKTGFGAPLRRWIREELREMVRDVLSEKSLARRGLFDPQAVQRLILSNERLETDASYMIFSLMCIEMWMRNFIDRQAQAAVL
ncbi:MAG: asparagine synthase (glutamine-hydrolyzing) [Acidobacteriota bacterium]